MRYAYAVNGVTYTGERISFDDPGSYLTYTEGDEVTVYYNPDRPERAVLEVGMDRGSTVVYLLAGLLVLGCGLVLVWLGRWSPYRPRWSYAAPATPARKSSRRANRRNRRRSSQ